MQHSFMHVHVDWLFSRLQYDFLVNREWLYIPVRVFDYVSTLLMKRSGFMQVSLFRRYCDVYHPETNTLRTVSLKTKLALL